MFIPCTEDHKQQDDILSHYMRALWHYICSMYGGGRPTST